MIVGCAAIARRKGYEVFGVEYAGECWGTYKSVNYRADPTANDDDWEGCKYEAGIGRRVISVFEFE